MYKVKGRTDTQTGLKLPILPPEAPLFSRKREQTGMTETQNVSVNHPCSLEQRRVQLLVLGGGLVGPGHRQDGALIKKVA